MRPVSEQEFCASTPTFGNLQVADAKRNRKNAEIGGGGQVAFVLRAGLDALCRPLGGQKMRLKSEDT
jgi:hypothetical protein